MEHKTDKYGIFLALTGSPAGPIRIVDKDGNSVVGSHIAIAFLDSELALPDKEFIDRLGPQLRQIKDCFK